MAAFNQQSKISQLVCNNSNFIRTLARTKSQHKRRKLLKKACSEQLLTLAEICLNIVRSRFRLTTRQRKRLLPYADFVRKISRIKSERGARKEIVQKGSGLPGFFAALLAPILAQLASVSIKGKAEDKN